MKIRGLLPFSIYLLTTVVFTFLYTLASKRSSQPLEYDENAAGVVVLLQAIGHAAIEGGKGLSHWINFVCFCTLINLAFFIVLKLVAHLGVKELIFAFILTFSLSFLGYGLLHPLLQWIFGEYYSFTFIIVTVTLFTSRWTIQYSEALIK